jgi:monovalent cation/proton antiporter MnhG/PhaG subunit
MNARDIAVCTLLVVGVLGFVLCALGLLVRRDAYDQMHYLAPASLVGAVAIPIAVIVQDGFAQSGGKALAIMILMLVANPVLSHATMRAARIRRTGQWPPADDEQIPEAPRKQS